VLPSEREFRWIGIVLLAGTSTAALGASSIATGDFAQPNRFEWTMLIVAVLFNGAAWMMTGAVRGGAVRNDVNDRVDVQ
jgi:hypothetical protein